MNYKSSDDMYYAKQHKMYSNVITVVKIKTS